MTDTILPGDSLSDDSHNGNLPAILQNMTENSSIKSDFTGYRLNKAIPDQSYEKYLHDITASHLSTKIMLALIILGYFVFCDLFILDHPYSLYTRLLPISIGLILLFYHFRIKENRPAKTKLYNAFLLSVTLMMYAKTLMHIDDPDYAGYVTGLIVVLFLVSLDLRVGLRDALFFYFIPPVVFSIILWKFFEPGIDQATTLSNVMPMLVIGFAANRIQNNFRYTVFKSNHLLNLEKQRTDSLLKQTRETNRQLHSANRELAESEYALKRALQVRDKMFSVIAHDLRSPFNSLMGFSSLLFKVDPVKDPEKVKEYTSLILQTSHTLYTLTDNLLNWARSQTGEIRLCPKNTDIKELINEATEVVRMQARAKEIEIHQEIEPGLEVKADRETLAITLRNLLSNAVKYSNRGESIRISAENINDQIVIAVSDKGVGIDHEVQDNLFTIRDNQSLQGTENEKGTGLGLILCKNFTNMNNGTISVTSQKGVGSTFTISLPA